MDPPESSAHECPLPAATATAVPPKLETDTGDERPVVVPSPSRPPPTSPQHLIEPPDSSEHVCATPGATATAVLPRLDVDVGDV